MQQIDTHIEMPSKKEGRTNAKYSKYPFANMAVGDSWLVGTYSRTSMIAISNAARNWAAKRANGWHFAIRKMGDKMRIWRVE